MAVELYPSIVNRMVADSKSIDRSPQPESRPLPNVRVDSSSHDQDNEIAHLGCYHAASSTIRAIAHKAEDEDNWESERCSDRCECVRLEALEAEGPGRSW